MVVTTTGVVTIAGRLGDNTPFSAAGHLHADGKTWTLFAPLYPGKYPGDIAGIMTFEASSEADCLGVLDWTKPAQAGAYYPEGFDVNVDLLAAKYAAPPLAAGTAAFTAWGGGLPSSNITDVLTISSGETVTVKGINHGDVTLTLTPATGAFTGTFKYPATGATTPFGGVIYEKPSRAGYGLFVTPDTTGKVNITK
jgi:hypothetical protein